MPSIRLLSSETEQEIELILKRLAVDPYGIRIMAPKAASLLVEVTGISALCANILKQEMLSCGADCAIPRNALAAQVKKTACVLMGNRAQYQRLIMKLKVQPFGLAEIGRQIRLLLDNTRKIKFVLKAKDTSLTLGARTRIMGIVNVTPDSFSGDGLSHKSTEAVADYALQLAREGADVLDIGGESSRPGAIPVPLREELARTIPVIRLLSKKTKVAISIDTYKPEVAARALDNGASIVNDISGLRAPAMARLVARSKAAVVIMHMKGRPRIMQKAPVYGCLMQEIIAYLSGAVDTALQAGIEPERIMVDPGIGFGKTMEHNLEILKRLPELKTIGRPVMVGTSRKSFIGKILDAPAGSRLMGSVASTVLAAANGAHMVRVHDVFAVAQALKVADKILA